MFGDYNGDIARMLQVRLNRCTTDDCADEDTINNYFRSTLVGIYSNRIRFNSNEFGEDAFIRESDFLWNSVSTQVQLETVYKVSRTEIQLQDMHINLDELTEHTDSSVFRLE